MHCWNNTKIHWNCSEKLRTSTVKREGGEDLHAFLHDNRPRVRRLCEESKWSMTAEQRSRYLINPMPGPLLNIWWCFSSMITFPLRYLVNGWRERFELPLSKISMASVSSGARLYCEAFSWLLPCCPRVILSASHDPGSLTLSQLPLTVPEQERLRTSQVKGMERESYRMKSKLRERMPRLSPHTLSPHFNLLLTMSKTD